MNVTQAQEILKFSKSHEGYEADIPEADAAVIADAELLVERAAVAWNRNRARGPEVEGVLRLANERFDGSGDFEAPEAPEAAEPAETPAEAPQAPPAAPDAPEETSDEEWRTNQEPWGGYDNDTVAVITAALDATAEGNGGVNENGKIIKLDDAEIGEILGHVWAYETANKKRDRVLDHLGTLAARMGQPDTQEQNGQPAEQSPPPPSDSPPPEKGIDYSDLIAEVEARIAAERIHVPAPPEGSPVVMPYAIANVSDTELRELHHAFGAYAYYAEYRVQRHEAIAQRARQQADDIVRELLLVVAQYDDRNHERRMTFITAEVESSPHVVALRAIQRRHEVFAEAARRERDSYHKNVEFLSRQESMRHNEFLRGQK